MLHPEPAAAQQSLAEQFSLTTHPETSRESPSPELLARSPQAFVAVEKFGALGTWRAIEHEVKPRRNWLACDRRELYRACLAPIPSAPAQSPSPPPRGSSFAKSRLRESGTSLPPAATASAYMWLRLFRLPLLFEHLPSRFATVPDWLKSHAEVRNCIAARFSPRSNFAHPIRAHDSATSRIDENADGPSRSNSPESNCPPMS